MAPSEESLIAVARRLVGTLRERGASVALAESCTGGLAASALTAVPGASDAVWGGVVVYRPEAKVELLGVDAGTARRAGGVSREATAALAAAVRRRAGAAYGLAITGWAGPDGGTEADPVGTVYVALAEEEGVEVDRRRFDGDREGVRRAAARAALELLTHRLVAMSKDRR